MNNNINETEMQLSFENSPKFLIIRSNLESFNNTEPITDISKTGRTVYCFNGNITIKAEDRYWPNYRSRYEYVRNVKSHKI